MATPWIPDGIEPIVITNGIVGVPYSFDITPQDSPSGFVDPIHIRTFLNPPPLPFPPIPAPDFFISGLGWQIIPIPGNPDAKMNIFGIPTTPGTYQFMFQVYNIPDPPYPDPYSSRLFQITIILNKKKKRTLLAPPTICCDPKSFKDGICPPQVVHKGYYYDKISDNCYILRKK